MSPTNEEILKSLERNDLKYFDGSQRYGYNVNTLSSNGSTYFTWAVRKSNVQTVTYLLTKGADVNKRELGGATPLLLAIYLNRLEIVQCLTRRGADVKLRDSYETPLTAAVKQGGLEMIEFLLDNGSDPNDCDINGVPPLIKAIKENKLEIVDLFYRKKRGRVVIDAEKNTPLIAAVRNVSSLDTVQCLLNHGTNVNMSKNDKTPLAWAAEKGNLDLLKVLLSNRANVNKVGLDGNTPLATAVRYKQSEAATYLTNNKANTCKVGDNGKTPLLWAVLNEDFDMVTWLLDHGAEYIIPNVFLDAIMTKNLQIVKLLKERGALDLGNFDYDEIDTPPLAVAVDYDCVEIAKYLLENGQNVINDLGQIETLRVIDFLETNNIEMVKLLTEHGARLNDWTQCGDTVLTKAVEIENFDMVKYFVENDADVNQANEKGLTPLALAESNNDFQTFQYLVANGAEVNDDEDENNPKLVRYYRMAQESIAKRRKICDGSGSNQEEAGLN